MLRWFSKRFSAVYIKNREDFENNPYNVYVISRSI